MEPKWYNRSFTGLVEGPLAPNQVYVFNSYPNGINKHGTAKAALTYYGAQSGVGVGRTGQSYAIPVFDDDQETSKAVVRFGKYVLSHPELEFLVTPIGIGHIFKRDCNVMAQMFRVFLRMDNVLLPEEFVAVIEANVQKRLDGEAANTQNNGNDTNNTQPSDSKAKKRINIKMGDITKIKCDAIVNAANSSLLGGGGVDGCIHKAAGPSLLAECQALHGCETGNCKITGAYNLPCKRIIHAVGPVWHGGNKNEAELLASCYNKAIDLAIEHKLNSIAFPCISAGIFGFPGQQAAKIAVETVKKRIETDYSGEVIFVIYPDYYHNEQYYTPLVNSL